MFTIIWRHTRRTDAIITQWTVVSNDSPLRDSLVGLRRPNEMGQRLASVNSSLTGKGTSSIREERRGEGRRGEERVTRKKTQDMYNVHHGLGTTAIMRTTT
jgi:hypothetical protein